MVCVNDGVLCFSSLNNMLIYPPFFQPKLITVNGVLIYFSLYMYNYIWFTILSSPKKNAPCERTLFSIAPKLKPP